MKLAHASLFRFAVLVLVSLVCQTPSSIMAEESTTKHVIYSSKIVIKKGKKSSQLLAVLETNDLTGDEEEWASYIELKPNRKKHISRFQFTIPSSSTADFDGNKVIGLSFKVNMQGPSKKRQKWQFRIRNYKTKKWELLTENKKGDSNSWFWYTMEKSMAFNEEGSFLDRYTDKKNKKLWIRLTSNNKKDVLNLDYMSLMLTTANTDDETNIPISMPFPSPPPNSTPTPTSGNGLLAVGDTWTYDIGGYFSEQPYNTKVVMIDLYETTEETITKLKSQGKTVCCYFSAGTWEEWRDDASAFPNKILGKDMMAAAENHSILAREQYGSRKAMTTWNMH